MLEEEENERFSGSCPEQKYVTDRVDEAHVPGDWEEEVEEEEERQEEFHFIAVIDYVPKNWNLIVFTASHCFFGTE